jgi:FkbM family methyltransferase
MLSNIARKMHVLSRGLERPILLKLQLQGGLPRTYEKLNNSWFKSLGIDTVLDIGANTGQFTKTISSLLPNANIYSFEPLPDCFDKLNEFASKYSNIKAFNTGVGDRSGVMRFERNDASPSSSFLTMTDIHKEAFPYTEKSSTVEVKISKLDDMCENIDLGMSLFVKIDVQGYEDKVLKGGEKTVKKAKLVIVETSFVPLYESQPLFDDIYKTFSEWGFVCIGMIDQLSDPRTGQILQGDAIFIKGKDRN